MTIRMQRMMSTTVCYKIGLINEDYVNAGKGIY